jgi:hypothetical protein
MIEDKKKDADSIETTELPEHHRIHHLPLDKEYCDNQPDALESILQDLNSLFSAVGVAITVDDHTLSIDITEEKFASVTTRKAGRKKKDANQRYEEIMAYRETHTAEETFEWLGLTKQTYYRRIKELKAEAEKEKETESQN